MGTQIHAWQATLSEHAVVFTTHPARIPLADGEPVPSDWQWVNDEEPGLKEDLMQLLERLAPVADYRHHRTGEDNGDAHLKRTLIGHQATLPVTKGRLDLGPWEQVFYAEFDGRRRKRVVVKILGE